jgi:transposase-like protein
MIHVKFLFIVDPYIYNYIMATTGTKRKCSSYDASFKLKVVEYAESSNNSAAAREFCASEKVVRDWRNAKDKLLEMSKTKRSRKGKQTKLVTLEKDLSQWISDQRQEGYIVTMLTIR